MNKLESTSIQKQIKERYSQFLPSGGKLIVGVSGGPDSMALLYLLYKNEIPVFVVHINYGLRGAESDADQQLVEDICELWGIECCAVSLNGREIKGNFQEWARNQRYQIFRDLKIEMAAAGIAIGHHEDDQLETILFKMLRGGGSTSWRGLQFWDGEIFRPILDFSKSKMIAFCEAEAVPYRVDGSNKSNLYARNALRNTVFPVFDDFIPGWKSNLKSIVEKAELTDELLNKMLEQCMRGDGLSTSVIEQYTPHLQAAIIQRFVFEKSNQQLSKGQIEEAVSLLTKQTGRVILINDNWSLVKEREVLFVKAETLNSVEITLSKDELQEPVDAASWRIQMDDEVPSADLRISVDQISWPIRIKKWAYGDYFQPLGMSGTQKISDHLTNRKINASQREETLILIDSGGTICAILYPQVAVNGENGCISELVKITRSTQNVLSISKF